MTIITVYATKHFDYADSYGLIACQLARHLTALGVHVNAVALGKTVVENQPDDVRAVTSRPLQPSLGGIVTGYPTTYGHHTSLLHLGPRVAVTMFESTKLPAGWVEPLNEMDAVIVPSWFCADVFRRCGVTSPVHVVPLGVGVVYQPVERPPLGPKRPLTFLAFLDRGARKGGVVALQAFLRAFGDDLNYRLILKGRDSKTPITFANPNIDVIQRDMSEQELCQLYQYCDVLINPHKGEGFGLLPREFAATGGIALTTNWSGTADGLGYWGWPLPYTLERADWTGNARLEGQDLGEWATCDPEAVAQRLRQVAANIDNFRSMARNQAAHVQRMYSWRTFAEQVLHIWKEAAHGYATRAAAA